MFSSVPLSAVFAFASILFQGRSILADTPEWNESPIDKCVTALGPDPNADAVVGCFQQHQSAKRELTLPFSLSLPALPPMPWMPRPPRGDMGLIYRRSSGTNAQVQRASSPTCLTEDLPKHFELAESVENLAGEICSGMQDKVFNTGMGMFKKVVGNGVYKKLSELHGKQSILIKTIFVLTPAGRRAKQLTGAVSNLQQFCIDTIKALNAEEGGCTKELGAYNSLKAKKYKVLGALDGYFALKSEGDDVGMISVNFLDPKGETAASD